MSCLSQVGGLYYPSSVDNDRPHSTPRKLTPAALVALEILFNVSSTIARRDVALRIHLYD